jgi:hypothetical protein
VAQLVGFLPSHGHRAGLIVSTVAVGLAAGVLWEIGEWWGHNIVDDAIYVGYDDTIGDLVSGGAGALVAGLGLPFLAARSRLHTGDRALGGTPTTERPGAAISG